MKQVVHLLICLLLLAATTVKTCLADDTDLFLVNAAVSQQRPNVLILLDNTANWNTPFDWEKASLQSVVNGLTDQFNVGLMLFTETGSGNPNPDGAYVRYAIRQMTADASGVTGNKTRLVNLVNGLDRIADKSNGGKAGLTMYEAWQYYAGLSSYAGGPPGASNGKLKSDDGSVYGGSGAFQAGTGVYQSPKTNGCQNNFIIYISNGPVQDNTADTTTATEFLAGMGGNTDTLTVDPNGSQSNIADEYARFFASMSSVGLPNIVTYTIDVLPGDTGQGPGWTALLKSMAQQGKGKYFVGSDAATLTKALTDIFHEVMAVNSVFSSSTLPVNVSVRGTYLNQVYMAVFRPDEHSSPRWTGNLKQYKLGYTEETDTIYLADKNNLPAENTLSGFITPLATSIWTTASDFWDADYYPDAQGESSTPTSDAPDGALVEKGGAAQHVRVDYSYDTANNLPVRNLYTCAGCASGSSLTNYAFADSNTNVTASALGLVTNPVTITSLTRSGTTATATASNHGFITGDIVVIAGASQAEYNGSYSITVTDANTFTFGVMENPATPATVASAYSTILATKKGAYTVNTMTRSGTTVTVETTTSFSWTGTSNWTGSLYITGAAQTEYNGYHNGSFPPGTGKLFTFPVTVTNIPESPVTPATSAGSSTPGENIINCPTVANSSLIRSGSAVTVKLPQSSNKPSTPQACFPAGSTVTVTGAVPTEYNVIKAVTTRTTGKCSFSSKATCVDTLTFNLPAGTVKAATTAPVTPAERATSTIPMTLDFSATSLNVSSITRSDTTATVTTAQPYYTNSTTYIFRTGDTVCITQAAQDEYNKCVVMTDAMRVGSSPHTQFTIPVTVSPTSPATAVSGSSITATNQLLSTLTKPQLINWVRGQNNQRNDNPDMDDEEVRGYVHGDVLHSRPAVINYNRVGQPEGRDIVAYFGANDGVFHAVKGGDNDADGDEKWGIVFSEHFSKLKRLFMVSPVISQASPKPYFNDGSIGYYTYDANNDGRLTAGVGSNDKVYLFPSMRRGGRFYYALDVTDPDTPKFLWKKSNTDSGYTELGQTWSEPKSAKIRYQTDPVVIFGLGYDATANDAQPVGTATMGRGVMVADAATGAPIWQAGPAPSGATYNKTVADMTYSISADPVVLDTNNDGYADRIYAADTGGNLWRINTDSATLSNWTVSKIAALGGTGANARKFLYPPDVVYNKGYDAILIGSGDREHPQDTAVLNRFYMLKDDHALNAVRPAETGNFRTTWTESNLYDATANLAQVGSASEKATAVAGLVNASGWYVTLGKYNSTTRTYQPIGEKVVGGSVSVGGATYFATNVPAVSMQSQYACSSNLGESRLYAVNFESGTAILDLDKTNNLPAGDGQTNYNNTVLATSDRYQIQPGGGFAPSPVAAVVVLSGAPREAVIIGTSVMATPRQDLNRRHSIYWGLQID